MTVVNCQCGELPKVNITCLDWPFTGCCQGEFKCAGMSGAPTSIRSGTSSSAWKWTCPAGGGCPGGNCAGDHQWQEWVAAHNVYRCMHDAPPVVWDHYVFAAVYDQFRSISTLAHSASYDLPAPEGPAGENVAQGYPSDPLSITQTWYSEAKLCKSMPGCGGTQNAGHFTAMLWEGGTKIGCTLNQYSVGACHYKGPDTLGSQTPNTGGWDAQKFNVHGRVHDYSTCVQKVKQCGLPVDEVKLSVDQATGLAQVTSGIALIADGGLKLPAAVVGLSLVALAGVAVRRRKQAISGQEEAVLLVQVE